MAKLFLSYRRDDSKHAAGRLYLEMRREYAPRDIFFDVENIEGGVDFVDKLESNVAQSDVLLALLGQRWDEEQRLHHAENHVRRELVAAKRNGVAILPILLDEASMPIGVNLPVELQFILNLNALRLRHESFSKDSSEILNALRSLIIGRSTNFTLPDHLAQRMNEKLESARTVHNQLDLTLLPSSVRDVAEQARIVELKSIESQHLAMAASEKAKHAAQRARNNTSGFSYEELPAKSGGSGFWAGEGLADKRNGFGEYELPTEGNGRYSYSGQWKENIESGYGVVRWFSSEGTLSATAEGMITRGKLNGIGWYSLSEGHTRAGEFREQKIEGPGVYIWPNGSRYEGEWSNGEFHGLGAQWDATGSRPQVGTWRQGTFEKM